MRGNKGFTLIELLIVVAILAALAAIAIPRITTSSATAKQNACDTNVDIMNTQIEMYYVDKGSYPDDLDDITSDPNYFPEGAPECPLDGDYTMDSGTHRVSCNHSTE